MSDPESERLRRLRERQLADRDPLVKQRQFQHGSSVKEKRMQKPFSFAKAWADFPHVVRSPIYALIAGILVIIVLPILWESPHAILVGAGITLILLVFGVVTGHALDLRDNIKNNLK